MKEIPLVDYHSAYSQIKARVRKESAPVAVVDTWGDRLAWYLGRDYKDAYWIRSLDRLVLLSDGKEPKEAAFGFGAIIDLESLLAVVDKYDSGFILIDGHETPFLPPEALAYIEENLKLEQEFGHFSLSQDPYDTWPAWLYSWGIL